MGDQRKKDDHPPPPNSSATRDSRNFAGRLLDSASGLLQDAISSVDSQATSTLTNIIANEGKAGPSTAPATTNTGQIDLNGSLDTSLETRLLPSGNAGFREPASSDARLKPEAYDVVDEMSLDQFMQRAEDDISFWQHSHAAKGKQPVSGISMKEPAPRRTESTMSSASDAACQISSATVGHSYSEGSGIIGASAATIINETDGADVVKLLQDSNYSPWADPSEEDDTSYTIPREDMEVAEKLVRLVESTMNTDSRLKAAITAARDGQSFARFSSFFDAIENYHDDVWGYIQPLVEQARQESHIASRAGQEESPAIRRLRMILAHMGDPG